MAELQVEALADRSNSDFSFKNVNPLAKMVCNFQLGLFAWPEEPALATPGTKVVSQILAKMTTLTLKTVAWKSKKIKMAC